MEASTAREEVERLVEQQQATADSTIEQPEDLLTCSLKLIALYDRTGEQDAFSRPVVTAF